MTCIPNINGVKRCELVNNPFNFVHRHIGMSLRYITNSLSDLFRISHLKSILLYPLVSTIYSIKTLVNGSFRPELLCTRKRDNRTAIHNNLSFSISHEIKDLGPVEAFFAIEVVIFNAKGSSLPLAFKKKTSIC